MARKISQDRKRKATEGSGEPSRARPTEGSGEPSRARPTEATKAKCPKGTNPEEKRSRAGTKKPSKARAKPKKAIKKEPIPKKKKPKKIIFKTPKEKILKEKVAKRVSGQKAPPVSKAKVIEKPKAPLEQKAPPLEARPYAEKELPGKEAQAPAVEEKVRRKIAVDIPITVKDFAAKLGVKSNELMKTMIEKGIFITINQSLDEKTANDIAWAYGAEVEKLPTLEEEAFKEFEKEDEKDFIPRAPVVTFMGHVDHGKTSLLDMIRKTKVVAKEYGGITQHIGAYEVMLKNGAVTFLDTPGHEAFTEMRARGANATDIVVLVVAADDGVKPQTVEAIDHARAAGVPIVVALNKCDLPHIDIGKVKTQLSKLNLRSEDWGGKTIVVEVSAKTGKGIDRLLEMLLLEAELLELKANQETVARGVVIESELSRGRGVAATVLVQSGTLRAGNMVVAGTHYGKIKAMINDKGGRIQAAPPSTPIEILGLSGVPQAGEKFFVAKDEKKAREYCLQKQAVERERDLAAPKRLSLESLYQQIEKGQIKEFKIIVKGDVSGSIEALRKSLTELSTKDVKINVIHSAVGNINDSDVVLALASNTLIIGFHVSVEAKAQATADKEGVEIKLYNIIYEATADVKAAMEGMLEPIIKEVFLGRAQVRRTFTMSKVGTIAGCYVVKGRIPRGAIVKLVRGGKIIYEGKISSLKRFKDDIKEAAEGFECGIVLVNHNNIKEGDTIEAFEIQKIARRLERK